MSVLIDMEMPKACGYCALLTHIGDGKPWFCPATGKRIEDAYRERNANCPLRELADGDYLGNGIWT